MYARVVTAGIQSGRLDEAIDLWQTFVAPSARQQAGFRGARLFVDRSSGNVLSMGFWDSQQDFEATVQWNQGQVERFAALMTGAPQIRGYELAAEAAV